MQRAKSWSKFFLKVWVVGFFREVFLFLYEAFGGGGRRGEPRDVLIVNLEGIGDMVAFTSVLKHYRGALPGRRVVLLVKGGMGLEELLAPFVDELIALDYRSFARNPLYGTRFLARLRARAFQTVIAHDHAAAEVMGKIIARSLGAPETICYEGFGLQFEKPFDENMAAALRYAERHLYPRFTTLVKSLDRGTAHASRLPNIIDHYRHIYEAVTKRSERDYTTELRLSNAVRERGRAILATHNLVPGRYVVVNLGSSQVWKNWPVERFVAVAEEFRVRDLGIALIGSRDEAALAQRFKTGYHGACADLTGTLTTLESALVIGESLLVLSNDTSAVHLAIALGKPSVCILGGGHVGGNSLYGRADINRWIYSRGLPCFLDNWRCARSAPSETPAPCIAAVTAESVRRTLEELFRHLDHA